MFYALKTAFPGSFLHLWRTFLRFFVHISAVHQLFQLFPVHIHAVQASKIINTQVKRFISLILGDILPLPYHAPVFLTGNLLFDDKPAEINIIITAVPQYLADCLIFLLVQREMEVFRPGHADGKPVHNVLFAAVRGDQHKRYCPPTYRCHFGILMDYRHTGSRCAFNRKTLPCQAPQAVCVNFFCVMAAAVDKGAWNDKTGAVFKPVLAVQLLI